jgi:hypothetical protein
MAVKVAAMAVGPVEHGRDGQAAGRKRVAMLAHGGVRRTCFGIVSVSEKEKAP